MSLSDKVCLSFMVFMAGYVVGQEVLIHAHDPAVLEENTLNFVQAAYLAGCVELEDGSAIQPDPKGYDDCIAGSKKYRADIADIFHNKIWDRPAPKRKATWKANSF